jgi:hypothetical protein
MFNGEPVATVTAARYWESCPEVAVVGPLTAIDKAPFEL